MTDRARRTAIFLAAIAVTGWGMTGVFVRLVPHFSATFITSARQIVAFTCMIPAVIARRREILPTISQSMTWRLALALNAFFVFAVFGFQRATVAEVTLCIATAPVWILLLNLVRRVRISGRECFGAAAALTGVAIMTVPRISFAGAASRQHVLGEFLALFAAMGSAGYAAQFRSAHVRSDVNISTPIVTAFSFALGGVVWLAVSALTHSLPPSGALSLRNVSVFLAIGILSTALPSWTFAHASQALGAVITTTMQLMIPVIATLLAAAVLREWPPLLVIPGGFLVLFGTWYILRPAR
jgi:drug/metabolite transporter, DME family